MTRAQTPRVLLIGRTSSTAGAESGPEVVARNLFEELADTASGLCVAHRPKEWRSILRTARSPSVRIVHFVTSGRIDFLAPMFKYVHQKTIIVTFHGIAPMVPRPSLRQMLHYCNNAAMARSALRFGDAIVSVSALLKEEIAPRYPDAHHAVIHNGLSSVFRDWNLIPQQSDGCLKLLMVGFAPSKGLDFVLQALLGFTEHYPGNRWTLTIAGVNPHAESLLQEIISNHSPLLPHFRVMKNVPHEQMPSVYAGHDAVLICSSYESFGLVVLEAMSIGVPPIVSDRVGSSFLVRDGISGFIVEFGNVEQLVSVLGRLSAGVFTLDRKAMRNTAMEFSWRKAAHEYMRLYEDILNQEFREAQQRRRNKKPADKPHI